MNNKKYGFIYETTNKIDGKKYIGKCAYCRRKSVIKNYLGSGTLIKRAIKKYGKENFTRVILIEAESLEELNRLEKEIIKACDAVNSEMYYNIADGGDGGYKVYGEKNFFFNKKFIGEDNPMYGKKRPDVTGDLNPMRRPEVLAKFIGKKNPEQSKRMSGENHPLYGKGHTEESKKKMSESKQNKPNSKSKKVICLTTGKIFDFKKQGAKYYGLDDSSLNKHLKGINHYCGKLEDGTKLVWMFYDEYIEAVGTDGKN